MCFACTEYTKDRLTSTEFKSAIKEVGMDNPTHQKQVEELIRQFGDDTESLKKVLKPMETESKDY